MLLEAPAQIEEPISRLIYIYRFRDSNVKALEQKFVKNGTFLDSIPSDLESLVCENCMIVIDDHEDLLNSKENAAMIIRFANYIVHHKKIILCLVFQSYNLFYASSKLHSILFQCTVIVLFRSSNLFSMLKRVLNSYNVSLKSGTLYEIFKSYVSSRHKYLVINVSPKLDNALVYSSILYNDAEPFIIFT